MSCPVDAIALVTGQGKRGTGFLVRAADNRLLVLTAGHVADAPNLTVRFAAHAFLSPATVAFRGVSDWAALACTQPLPAKLAPIELDDLDGPPSTPFETFGYPNLYGALGDGGPLSGHVRRTPGPQFGGRIQPMCYELQDKAFDLASGISGAPCLVADVAIGVICAVLGHANMIVAGSLLVVPASVIASESGGVIALATDPRLPFLPDTELPLEALNPGLLARMITALELDCIAGQQKDALRRRVARGLLIAAPERVADALVSVKEVQRVRESVGQLVVQRESLGISAVTVQCALRLLESGGPAALNARLEVSARLLLRRMSWAKGYVDRWYLPQRCLIVNPAEDTETAVVNAVRSEAEAQLLTSTPDAALNASKRSVFAVIFRVLPRREVRKALADAFPRLRVIFCSDRPSASAASDLSAPWIEPFSVATEDDWRTTCLAARGHLRDNAVISFNDNQFDRME